MLNGLSPVVQVYINPRPFPPRAKHSPPEALAGVWLTAVMLGHCHQLRLEAGYEPAFSLRGQAFGLTRATIWRSQRLMHTGE